MIMWIIWFVVMVGALMIEAATVNMTTIWFAIGALVALVMSLTGFSLLTQIIIMMVISVACFALFWFVVKPKLNRKKHVKYATNADRIIGEQGVVTVAINPIEACGQIKVLGQIWSATTQDGTTVTEGTLVKVISLSGVRATVTRLN